MNNEELYFNLRRSKNKNKPHEVLPNLYDINISKFAKQIEVSLPHLNLVINGERKPSKELNDKIINLSNLINEGRKEYYNEKDNI